MARRPSCGGRRAPEHRQLADDRRGDLALLTDRRVRPAEAGDRAGLVVVRNGRVVHHELDPALEAKGVLVCGLATCEEADVAPWLGICTDASPVERRAAGDASYWTVARR